ncbi:MULTISPECIES: RidA family protein [unclassified Corynebacterium]|uniref:RidA family protein n=1 Tax=unclassified Corynebacterium TaxID=2624378 RepID=UPI0021AA5B11|nr:MULTISPECIES: RidA family protein [unclassified Corynebacterium]MCT1451650.1 RidA family protein [Corynebacterium sp. p3-SID1145]MCT1460747.1 RidA family protein [Corynebacterium sp. p3-SID1140]MDN8594168.1 RidA family protein [Corynebacterium sp. P4_F2]WKK55044.1 RidA family protein [Corynebacterium sp. P4-C1]WKK62460.1 RidA family protein [Corynebacterium sp. P8-C1]
MAANTPANIKARLDELGIQLPQVAAPVAAYVPATQVGNQVWTSGQLPFADGELPATGKVGAEVSAEDAYGYARTAALNALAAVDDAVGLDNVTRVVKIVGYVASAPDFGRQPSVVNGASELIGDIFGEAGAHVRSAVGVAVLPLDSPVEVELIVEVEGVDKRPA